MLSMCLGMVADFDERAGDYPAAIATLEAAIATNDALGSAASPAHSWPGSAGRCSKTASWRVPRSRTSGPSTSPAA